MGQARYYVAKSSPEAVHIVDEDGEVSVTNDAERVVAALFRQFGDRRFYYRDAQGDWDELLHAGGVFKGLAPAHSKKPASVAVDKAAGADESVETVVGLNSGILDAARECSDLSDMPSSKPVGGGGEFAGAGASGDFGAASESSPSESAGSCDAGSAGSDSASTPGSND
jgi:hypothetical protein